MRKAGGCYIGLRSGLTAEDIVRVTIGSEAPGWDRRQVALLRAVDEFHHNRQVVESTWHMLTGFFDHRLMLEALMLIGFYEGLAGVLNSTGLRWMRRLKSIWMTIPDIIAS